MGTWDIGSFGNDHAFEWLDELAGCFGIEFLDHSLKPEELDGHHLETRDGVRILCACEILAALRGQPARDLPHEALEWLSAHEELEPELLLPKAIEGVDRVLAAHSDLDEFWSANQTDYPKWRAAVEELRLRLGA